MTEPDDELDDDWGPPPPPPAPPPMFPTYTLEELDSLPPAEWLLPFRLPEGVTLLYGAPSAGKTFLALDWCAALASGALGPSRPVVYFAGEGIRGISKRLNAWRWEHALEPKGLVVANGTPRLGDDYDATRLRATVHRHQAEVFVLDTWARCMAGLDENDAGDVTLAMAVVEELARDGASCLIVHHSGRTGNERGSTALKGAVDMSWSLTRWPGSDQIEGRVSKPPKDFDEPPPFYFRLQPVETGSVVVERSIIELMVPWIGG